MAYQKESCVLLGFEDELVTEKHRNSIDYTSNKIGGKPDWCLPTNVPTKCRLCGSDIPLVVQIYAPLEGSKFHRTLYLFACIQPMCWNRNESWLCIRQQTLWIRLGDKNVTLTEPSASSVSYWNEEADNWGDSDEDVIPSVDQENGNIVVQRPIKQQRLPEDTDTDDSSLSLEEPNDPNANSAGAEGAFAVEFNNKVHIATAEIEIGDETEIVSIDTPICPQQVTELFKQANSKCRNIVHPEFISSFISVAEEVLCGGRSKLTDHEMALLHQYQHSELGDGDLSLDGRVAEVGGGGELTAEQYEKEQPIHGDILAHRFIARIQQVPGQLLRYGRNTEPLLLQSLPKGGKGQRCQYCGSETVFELQLLPSLLSRLEGDISLEFGTVLIYTCKDACWSSDDSYKEEKLIVQAESI